MANILKATYEADNFKPNSRTYNITVTLDEDIATISDINLYLPNNGSLYQKIDGIALVPSNSSATILTPIAIYLCVFIAENGSVNSNTKYQEGIWKCLGKKDFL